MKKRKPTGMSGGKPRKKKSTAPWLKAIPSTGVHGSGLTQKRLWRLVSDYCRIRDFHRWKVTVDSGEIITDWHDTDAGHYHAYSVCNGMFKFDERNVHAQSRNGNAWGGASAGHRFAEELVRRYGKAYPRFILEQNARFHGTTVNESKVIEKIEDVLAKMAELPEQPDYFQRVMELRDLHTL